MPYSTKQKQEIISFFLKNDGEFSAAEVAENIPSVGKSSVYRLLSKMAESGILRISEENRTMKYSYIKNGCRAHLHCKCTSCGELLHLSEDESMELRKVLESSGLKIDEKGMIPVICKKCMEGKK